MSSTLWVAQAGLRPGDVIVAINGQMIDERHPLINLFLQYVAGETITVEVLLNIAEIIIHGVFQLHTTRSKAICRRPLSAGPRSWASKSGRKIPSGIWSEMPGE